MERNYKVMLVTIGLLVFISTLTSCFSLFFTSKKLNEISRLLKDSNQQLSNLTAIHAANLPLKRGDKAPPFSMVSLDGKKYSLKQFKNKKKVVLMAWTTTCRFCEEALSGLEKFYKKNKRKDVEFFTVVRALDDAQRKVVSDKVKEYKLSLPVLVSDASDTFGTDYKVRMVPTMWVIGKTGLLEGVYVGKENIDPVLEGGKL